jgi:predicted AAA+ superfamily ATPase
VVDSLLAELVEGLPAVSVEGAKAVGKTATASRLARSTVSLDEAAVALNVAADPRIVAGLASPTLIDEWQLVPAVWDAVRREVDNNRSAGRFIMTGSASPAPEARVHSGAGRIVRLVMRPMTLPERGVAAPAVSFAALLAGGRPEVSGRTDFGLAGYAEEIVASGFPGIRQDPPRLRARQLDSYIANAVDHEIPELGARVRRPRALRAWLAAYAAATATTASYTSILDAATPGEADKLSRPAMAAYRELLERVWLLDPLPAWVPSSGAFKRLGQASKHHLVDPALAARLLGATRASLLVPGGGKPVARAGTLLGALFESLAALTIRVFAEPLGAAVSHLRPWDADHEIDLIVERDDHRVLALEVKLAGAATAPDTRRLAWLEREIGDRLIDRVVITTGPFAHRLADGTAVVPLALLGP